VRHAARIVGGCVAPAARRTDVVSATLQPPLPLSTRCLILKAHASSLNCLEPPEEDEQMKASALFGAGWENDSVEVLWQDAGRAFCKLGRNGPAGDTHAFIPVLSGSEHPTLEIINRLIREYELKDDLAADWALRPVELVGERGRTMLVVDYVGGEPLDRLVGEPMEVGGFLHPRRRCLAPSVSSTDAGSFTRTSSPPT
jgi:hypothetical protein